MKFILITINQFLICLFLINVVQVTQGQVHKVTKYKSLLRSSHPQLVNKLLVDDSDKNDVRSIGASGDEDEHTTKTRKYAIRPSIFPNVPPFIDFASVQEEQVERFPDSIRKHLKWRVAHTKSRVIMRTARNSGLRLVSDKSDWVYLWDKFMKNEKFYTTLKPYQKLNQLKGSGEFCNKDRLWKHFNEAFMRFGNKYFDFVPQTYVLPMDMKRLKVAWDQRASNDSQMWFLKAPRKANGNGIYVISNWNQVPTSTSQISLVQEYIKPLLVNHRKFDLRLYVLVTSYHPLRAYFYQDGFVRFASMKYSNDSKDADKLFMHLTNLAINKKSESYVKNHDINSNDGNQWSVQALWRYLENQGIKTEPIVKKIQDVIIKTLIMSEKSVLEFNHLFPTRQTAYQLYGFDIGLDDQLKPWLFEINSSPGMSISSGFLITLKAKLVKEYFNIVGYHFPPTLSTQAQQDLIEILGNNVTLDQVTFDERLYTHWRSKKQIRKHKKFTRDSHKVFQNMSQILDHLTPDDVRQLITVEEELNQCDGFVRIFPTQETQEYLKLFQEPRYYNLLLNAWEQKYGHNRQIGIDQLKKLCQNKFHLKF